MEYILLSLATLILDYSFKLDEVGRLAPIGVF